MHLILLSIFKVKILGDKMLSEQAIALDVEVQNAEDAIKFAGELLKHANLCSDEYVNAMLINYRENGSYFVIAPKLALPHARPEAGAIHAGISFLKLATPINFGHPENDPVSLVIGISATSSDLHLEVIRKIVTVLGDTKNLESLLVANSKEQVLALFNH